MDDSNLILPGDSRPTRADAVKNRELLLETASRLFDVEGVEAVSMSQIAQEAGVGKGTLYRHFDNKIALCQALLDRQQRDLQNRTLTRIRACVAPCECLRWFLNEVLDFVGAHDDLLTLDAEGISMIGHPAHLWWRQTIRGLLTRMAIPGDVDYMTDVLYAMLDANMVRFQRHHLDYDLERIRAGLMAVVDRLDTP